MFERNRNDFFVRRQFQYLLGFVNGSFSIYTSLLLTDNMWKLRQNKKVYNTYFVDVSFNAKKKQFIATYECWRVGVYVCLTNYLWTVCFAFHRTLFEVLQQL